jgi:hypothetical protein
MRMRCIMPRLQRALVPFDGRLSNHATTQPCNSASVQPCNLRHTFLSLVSFFLPYNIALQLAHRAGLHALSMLLSAAQATAVPCRVLTRSPRVCMLHDTERTARGAACAARATERRFRCTARADDAAGRGLRRVPQVGARPEGALSERPL